MTKDMPGPIGCFLSYAQQDDDVLGFVDQFRKELAHYCAADHGRRVEVFLDRESIGWGEQWQSGINQAIEGAMVFLPLITLTYFERPYCREELTQFYSSARTRGVTELLLPVVVLGHKLISVDNDDHAVQVIADRQWFDFKDAAIEGPGSPVWRATMVRLAAQLVAAVEQAEHRLAAPAPLPAAATDLETLGKGMVVGGERLTAAVTRLARALDGSLPALREVAELVEGASAEQRRERIPAVAALIARPGGELERHGVELQAAAEDLDLHLRAYHEQVMALGPPELRHKLSGELGMLSAGTVPLDQMRDMCADFLDVVRPVELLSLPMRDAVRPMRAGLQAVQNAIGIIHGWMALG